MSTYNIKLEDKAAFINRLDKLGVGVESYEIKDDKLKGAFEFTVDDPVVDKIVKTILKQSPKINTIREMKTKMTKKQLAEIIREELASMKKKKVEETQQLNEMDPSMIELGKQLGLSAAVIASLFAGASGVVRLGLNKLKSDIKKQNPNISDEEAEDKATAIFGGSLDKAVGKNVDMDRWQ